jgi:glycosyltransferase involved in cell wall biosynthesis
MTLPVVLIVMPLAEQRGGAELALMHLIQTDSSICWHIAFLEDGPMVERARQAGAGVSLIKAGRVRQPHKFAGTIFAIARLAKRIQARAILAWMAKAHLYCGPAAMLAGIPAVWFQHGLPRQIIDSLAVRIPAAGSLACSKFVADEQQKMMPHIPVRVVHPPTDLATFSPTALPSPQQCRRDLALGSAGPLIGIFGRLQRWKGFHVLIAALPTVLASYPSATAAIVGGVWHLEPKYKSQLGQQVDGLNVADHVIFAGHQQDVARWMQACDVIVHASDCEPFGMTVVEAMSLGKPVVAGACGGPREVITDGVDGLLVPFGDSQAMAAAILRYLNDGAFAAAIGNAARRRAEYFSAARFARNISDAMRQWMLPLPASKQPKVPDMESA